MPLPVTKRYYTHRIRKRLNQNPRSKTYGALAVPQRGCRGKVEQPPLSQLSVLFPPFCGRRFPDFFPFVCVRINMAGVRGEGATFYNPLRNICSRAPRTRERTEDGQPRLERLGHVLIESTHSTTYSNTSCNFFLIVDVLWGKRDSLITPASHGESH